MNAGHQSLQELIDLAELAETPEQLESIERQVLALESADRDSASQKATLGILTQQAVAFLLGVSSKHIRDHQPARNADGTYYGPDLVNWHVDRAVAKAKKDWERDSDSLKTAAERQAEAKAIKYEEEAKGVQDSYVERSHVLLEFMEMAASVRSELEALPKSMANDFPAEVREPLMRELKNQCKQILRRLAAKGAQFDG